MRALAMSMSRVSTRKPQALTPPTSARASEQREVEVVDHEIEDHVDLGAALLEAGEPLGVDVERLLHALGRAP